MFSVGFNQIISKKTLRRGREKTIQKVDRHRRRAFWLSRKNYVQGEEEAVSMQMSWRFLLFLTHYLSLPESLLGVKSPLS